MMMMMMMIIFHYIKGTFGLLTSIKKKKSQNESCVNKVFFSFKIIVSPRFRTNDAIFDSYQGERLPDSVARR